MRAFLSVMGMYQYDNTIFRMLEVPTDVSKELVINKILIDNAELGLVYPDLDTFKEQVAIWSAVNFQNWERIWAALQAEYNPIHNYNMEESWEDHSEGTGDGTSERDVAGFNENQTLVHDSKLTDNNSSEVDSTHEGRRSGNIGVTTSQQMIEAEMALRAKHNFYQIVSDSFKRHFCIMIY